MVSVVSETHLILLTQPIGLVHQIHAMTPCYSLIVFIYLISNSQELLNLELPRIQLINLSTLCPSVKHELGH